MERVLAGKEFGLMRLDLTSTQLSLVFLERLCAINTANVGPLYFFLAVDTIQELTTECIQLEMQSCARRPEKPMDASFGGLEPCNGAVYVYKRSSKDLEDLV